MGRGTEEEEDLDPIAARQFLTQPSKLLALDSALVQKTACVHNVPTHTGHWVAPLSQGRLELREGVGRGIEEEEDLDP